MVPNEELEALGFTYDENNDYWICRPLPDIDSPELIFSDSKMTLDGMVICHEFHYVEGVIDGVIKYMGQCKK